MYQSQGFKGFFEKDQDMSHTNPTGKIHWHLSLMDADDYTLKDYLT